ncbi:hypothetical protein [Nocardioides jensenii]|uniref:hypothetical protein n=1 Tax=Nocardioides jensenii TaxID=1843 RepID=UPI000ABE9F1B|nr:hypothetical protein [Nocardioides jensenii]
MRRTALVCAIVLLLAGLTAGCGGDSDQDSAAKESESASATDSASEGASGDDSATDGGSEDASESSDSDAESSSAPAPDPDGSVEPAGAEFCDAVTVAAAAKEFDELQEAVDGLVAKLPAEAGADVKAGLDVLDTTIDASADKEEFVTKARSLTARDQKVVTAYTAYESAACAESTP